MIGAIENGILARLKAAADAGLLGYDWNTLETYPEDWDTYLKDKIIRAPAAWVVFAGWGAPDPGASVRRVSATFGLVVMAENARNETATRHGGGLASEPGSYQLMVDACALLDRSDLSIDIDSIEVGTCRSVRPPTAIAERRVSMYAIELLTGFAISGREPFAPAFGDFATFHADWDIPPFRSPVAIDASTGTPGVQLPDDAHADAVDHVILETLP